MRKLRKQPQIPPFFAAAPYVVAGVLIATGIAMLASDPMNGIVMPVIYVIAFISFIAHSMRSFARYRAWRSLVESDFKGCPICEYALNGLPPAGECPECGEAYEMRFVQMHWMDYHTKAAKTEPCLRMSQNDMNRYIRYSVRLLMVAVVVLGHGVVVLMYTSSTSGRLFGQLLLFSWVAFYIIHLYMGKHMSKT